MPKGLSLNIGINELLVKLYCTNGALCAPCNDARAMAAIAVMEGYESPTILLNEQATKQNFLAQINEGINRLEAGDTFLITFSGHGGQIKDNNGDEKDGMDETWCFYDEPLIDDEIGEKWKLFKSGVQIIVISSSCHSGSAIKYWDKSCFTNTPFAPMDNCEKEIIINDKTILSSHMDDPEIKADIIHLSACEDKQEASDGHHFTKFTGLLLQHWDYGRFTGNYQDLVANIQQRSGYLQKPGLRTLGANKPYLHHKTPFKIN